MKKSKTGSSARFPFWNDQIHRFESDYAKLPKVVRDEMNSAMELMERITEKSTEVTMICRGFVKMKNPLYQEVVHDSMFHGICFAWAGRCLAYAQPRSLEYVQGLQARANLHYHVGNWDECLLDAREALDQMKRYKLTDLLGTAKRLGELLAKAEAKAIEHRPGPHPSMNNYEPLDLENQKPPNDGCLFDGVEPAYNEEWGRHLVAKRDIKVGEMILVEDMDCCVLTEEKIHTNCSHCAAQAWCGVACEKCVYALYCSVECKDAAWSEYHEIECQIFEEVNRRKNRMECQAALRLLIKFIKMEGLEQVIRNTNIYDIYAELFRKCSLDNLNILISSTYRWYYSLLDRAGNDKDTEMIREARIIDEYADAEESSDNDVEADDAVLSVVLGHLKPDDVDEDNCDYWMRTVRKIFKRLQRIFRVNSHWFGLLPRRNSPIPYTAEVKCFAFSFYSSLINHDCFNNSALAIGKGGKLMAYAVAPIKKNEQVTISYSHMVHFKLDAITRRLNLVQERKFICNCRGCVDEWVPRPPRTPTKTLKTNIFHTALMHHTSSNNNWYLTMQQIISNKVIVEFIYKQIYESSPAAAFRDTGHYRRFINLAYHMMYGVEWKVPEQCHFD
ncbi:SET and MYND domain-containing protein DDB_G0273589-like [Trichogramma pretiosum]|uniref:SET and MYND domain-containing protein DDB_G0273589-like n=1 Tax=Trichogramma pretiosum TaxID=7493 RepID=UPI0006C9D474|nr:SET and MYND domain-containing protein DDB_G0273589-like [Trichogramma pretiosum]